MLLLRSILNLVRGLCQADLDDLLTFSPEFLWSAIVDNRTYFHTLAFRGSVTNGTTNTTIAGVLDQIIPRNAANNFLTPEGSNIKMAVAGGVNASRARINTPSLREVGLPYIAPLQTGVAAQSPPNIAFYGDYGPRPRGADELSVESTHTDAAAQIQFALVWLTFGRKAIPPGQRYRLRNTAAITGVIGSWASGSMTPDQTLPSGIYAVVGMDAFGTNLLGARLIFSGGGYRPGVLARNAVASIPSPLFTNDELGVFGEFDSVALPTLEIYVEAANSAQEIYLDLVRIGNRS